MNNRQVNGSQSERIVTFKPQCDGVFQMAAVDMAVLSLTNLTQPESKSGPAQPSPTSPAVPATTCYHHDH